MKKQMTFKTFRKYCMYREPANSWGEALGGCKINICWGGKCNIKDCQPWKGFRDVKN